MELTMYVAGVDGKATHVMVRRETAEGVSEYEVAGMSVGVRLEFDRPIPSEQVNIRELTELIGRRVRVIVED
jgi:hypothetical protein